MSIPPGEPRFPPELVERVFSELRYRAAIISRLPDFKTVTLFSLNEDHDAETDLSQGLLSFLASNPQVTSVIRTLILDHVLIQQDPALDYWHKVCEKFSTVVQHLSCLEHVTIFSSASDDDWTLKAGRIRPLVLQLFFAPSIQWVELRGLRLDEHELSELLCIPELTLSRTKIALLGSTNPSTAKSMGSVRLRKLSVITPEERSELPWITFNFAKKAAQTLEQLNWMSFWEFGADAYLDVLDLHALPSLKRLSISVALNEDQFSRFVDLITLRSRSGIEILEILCDYDSLPDDGILSSLPWEKLDVALTGRAYPCLRRVVISVKAFKFGHGYFWNLRDYDDHCTEAASLFESRLPRLQRKGLICAAPRPIDDIRRSRD
ncbi:hypothetical protein CVT26_009018 [Gymnopilus dilepis]|uniref:F-box domain-containing protein n=1 Tax=Gymnopilus dilepis TaxID=231916 RepID=A0A409YB77_9AGAR|nr:hypothetical protein CVT26_009018 [Gymnopilus dilepis]